MKILMIPWLILGALRVGAQSETDVEVRFLGLMLFNETPQGVNVFLPKTPVQCPDGSHGGNTHRFRILVCVGSSSCERYELDGESVRFDFGSTTDAPDLEVDLDDVLPLSRFGRRSAVKLASGLESAGADKLNGRILIEHGQVYGVTADDKHRWPKRWKYWLRPRAKAAAREVVLQFKIPGSLSILHKNLGDCGDQREIKVQPNEGRIRLFVIHEADSKTLPFHWLYFSSLTDTGDSVNIPEAFQFARRKDCSDLCDCWSSLGVGTLSLGGALCPPGKLP